jgi:hypothetical protein
MGSGESWLHAWLDVVDGLDDAELLAHLHRHPAPPVSWQRCLDGVLSKRSLQARVWVRPDAAWPVYVRNELREGGVRAPWCWRNTRGMAPLVNHRTRELSFWGRWCAAERAEGRLEAWLQAQPPPPEAWRAVGEALQRQVVPEEPHELWLACSLAAHGEPEPPWAAGIAPPRRGQRVGDDRERSDLWFKWVLHTFDDAPTYQSYLRRHPASEDWQRQLEEWFPWLRGDGEAE